MQERLETRLNELREEYASGQKVMAELQNRQAELHQTLLAHQRRHPGAGRDAAGC
jgi:peptidoglycan hydrolase CwlO-like protein